MPSREKVKKAREAKAAKGLVTSDGVSNTQIKGTWGDENLTAISPPERPAKPKPSGWVIETHENARVKLKNATKTQNGKAEEAIGWLHFLQTLERMYDFSEPDEEE